MEEKKEFVKLKSDLNKVKKEIQKIEELCELVCSSGSEKEKENIWTLARESIYDLRFALNILEFSLHNSKKDK